MKRLLAIFLSATLILSVMGGIFTVSAETPYVGSGKSVEFTETYNGKTVEEPILVKSFLRLLPVKILFQPSPQQTIQKGIPFLSS